MAKKNNTSSTAPTNTTPSFEVALTELETIVDDLEVGEPTLAEALAKYERGIQLLGRCQGLLEGAERTIALLEGVDDKGQPQTAPFDATATADRDRASSPQNSQF